MKILVLAVVAATALGWGGGKRPLAGVFQAVLEIKCENPSDSGKNCGRHVEEIELGGKGKYRYAYSRDGRILAVQKSDFKQIGDSLDFTNTLSYEYENGKCEGPDACAEMEKLKESGALESEVFAKRSKDPDIRMQEWSGQHFVIIGANGKRIEYRKVP